MNSKEFAEHIYSLDKDKLLLLGKDYLDKIEHLDMHYPKDSQMNMLAQKLTLNVKNGVKWHIAEDYVLKAIVYKFTEKE